MSAQPFTEETGHSAADAGAGSMSLCVMASGSSGNSSVVVFDHAGFRRACLIDLGVSPKRTWRLLAELGIEPHQVDDAIITHLDSDHFHPGWLAGGTNRRGAMPAHVRVRLHAGHARRLARDRAVFPAARVMPFDREFVLQSGARVRPQLLSHDAEGVTAMRIDAPAALGAGSLGFATDLGRVTPALVDLFRAAPDAVDVLAIESNYCPRLQAESGRPVFLIHRITGGHGHLSNQEAIDAIRAIEPREHVVLLHLSRECNRVPLVATMHEGADYHLTIAAHELPTRWIPVRGPRERLDRAAERPREVLVDMTILDQAARSAPARSSATAARSALPISASLFDQGAEPAPR
ncbi:MAG: MBL fold metallo-hydrolase [Phycisphaerales bacterium]